MLLHVYTGLSYCVPTRYCFVLTATVLIKSMSIIRERGLYSIEVTQGEVQPPARDLNPRPLAYQASGLPLS